VRAVIHQIYFFPWLGYFSKLACCDLFVILDDVYFRKRHYMDRTKIINMQGEVSWLNLPIGENFQVPCNEIIVPYNIDPFRIKETLRHSYSIAKHFNEVWPEVAETIDNSIKPNKSFVETDLDIIKGIMSILSIKLPQIERSSMFSTANDPTKRIIDICKVLGVKDLVIGNGKSQEVHDVDMIMGNDIDVWVHDYMKFHPEYKQIRRSRIGFEKGLSALDMLFNEGIEITREAILSSEVPIYKLSKKIQGSDDV
jgi:hypothetical protein